MSTAADDRASAGDMLRSLFFYIVFYVGTVGYVLSALAAVLFGRKALTAVVCAWSRFHRRCMRFILGIRIEISGMVPQGQVLIALKHESFAEAIDLPALLGAPVIFAKAELLRIPLWGWAAGTYGLVAVERSAGAKALRTMIQAARQASDEGRPLAIFPEGTRVPHGQRPALQAGFAALYKLLSLPVVPVAIDSGRLYHRRWKRGGILRIVFGETIAPGLPRVAIEQRVHSAINALNA